MQTLSVRQFTGYSLLLVSCVAWVALPVVPFLPLSGVQKAGWGGGLFLFAELTWWLAMPLLGKELVDWTQSLWRKLKTMLSDETPVSAPHYFSFIEQALHYFDRPHEEQRLEPVTSTAAWRGDQLPPLETLACQLNEQEIEEIRRAVQSAARSGVDPRTLTAEDFPLPSLETKFQRWRDEIQAGLGFQVIRGVPVTEWTAGEGLEQRHHAAQ